MLQTSLTFTLVAVGGALVKAILDAEGDRRPELKAESDAWDERRRTLVRELTDVFLASIWFGNITTLLSARATLEERIRNEKNPDQLERLWFDFVGEAFDGWRHGLERGVEIETVREAWRGYKRILVLLMRARLDRKTGSGVAE